MIKTITTNLEVDTKIVRLLSKSTYQRSFSSAIRELVSNAYDADSLSVNIKISEYFDEIEVLDDGNGMTYSEFSRYLTIAGTKSQNELTRKYKRKRIGQFGIGFLSIFPFCDELEIITTSENSTELLSTIIPAKEYMNTGKQINVSDIPIVVKIAENKAELKEHYTKMRLIKPTYLVKNYFNDIETKRRDSIYAWNPFKKFIWELREDLSVKYKVKGELEDYLDYQEPIGINVLVNGDEIFRNKLPEVILLKGEHIIDNISFKYLYSSDFESIKPFEARGVKIRVNNVGVGKRTDFNLKRDRGFSRLHWISGEVQIESKAKSYLSINRDEFISSPSINEIIEFCANKLREAAYYVESVAIAEKNIEEVFQTTIKDTVAPKSMRIDSSIKSLEKKGFEIVEDASKNETISIDKKSKTIYVNKSLEKIENETERIKILNQSYLIRYSTDFNDWQTPCELINNEIVLNSNYPLFKSKTYGAVFRKIILIMLIESKMHKNGALWYKNVTENFITEFKEFI